MSDNGWDVEKSVNLYQVEGWGAGYFQINAQGHVEAITDGFVKQLIFERAHTVTGNAEYEVEWDGSRLKLHFQTYPF